MENKKTEEQDNKPWTILEKGLSMFTPDYMADGHNQPEMQKRDTND